MMMMMKSVKKIFSTPEYFDVDSSGMAVEMDQESNGSSVEEGESPKYVDRRNWKSVKMNANAHIQIWRIREEDSHIGEDIIGEGILSLKDKFGVTHNYMIYSRPILPSSPLSGKSIAN